MDDLMAMAPRELQQTRHSDTSVPPGRVFGRDHSAVAPPFYGRLTDV